MSNFYAALEVGTSRTILAIAEANDSNRLKVICHESIPSTGVRKSQILDISHAAQSIKSILHAIENKQAKTGSKVTIGNAFLVVTGQHIKAFPSVETAAIGGSKVKDEDINEVLRRSRNVTIPNGRFLIDVFDQDYTIDGRGEISDPKGMAGRILGLNTLQILADDNRIQDLKTAAYEARLEIRETMFATTCAADAVLEEHERKNGVLVLEFGGGSTGYAVYSDDRLVTTGVIGVGGDHITNDIAHAFQTTNAQAETLKVSEASAMPGVPEGEAARVKIPGTNPLFENRTISKKALNTVVNARVKEMISIIYEQLENQDLLHRLHAGTVIVGGGARLRDLDVLIKQMLGTHVRVGRPINIDGFEGEPFSPAYATIAGALLYAYHNFEEKSVIDELFGRFFSK